MPEYLVGSVGERVQDILKERKLTQAWLSEKTGIPKATLSRYLSDAHYKIPHDALMGISKALGISADFLLGFTNLPTRRNLDVEALGLSEKAARRLLSGDLDFEIVNLLLEHKDFGTLCGQIRYYFDDTFTAGYLGRNEILDVGIDASLQYAREHPEARSEARETARFLNAQKASADEINTEKISKGFMKILKDIRTSIREQHPPASTLTHDALEIIQASIAGKPRSELTPDDLAAGVMNVVDSRLKLKPSHRGMVEGFVRWVMRTFGGRG